MASSSTSSSERQPRGLRRFVFEVAAFGLVQVMFYGVLIGGFAYETNDDYMSATIDKHARLEQLPSPRLIFVGGSSLAFGLDSAAVQQAFPGYHVVNMGLHAALMRSFMLEEAAQNVRSGDVVVLALEHQHLYAAKTTDMTTDYLLQLLQRRPASARYLTLTQTKSVLDNGVLPYLGSTVRNGYRNFSRAVRGKGVRALPPSGAYSRNAFNRFGDVVGHHDDPNHLDLTRAMMSPNARFRLAADAVRALRRFADRCRAEGAMVVFAYPQLPQPYFDLHREEFLEIDAGLRAANLFPILNRPDDPVMPVTAFFDTVYHLNKAGTEKRTAQLIEALRPVLEELDKTRRSR